MLVTTAPPVPVRAPTPSAVRRPHLWQVDIVRLLTFAAVIAVHTLAFTEQPGNRGVGGAMMLLQFGREVFFSLTGFVLVWSTWSPARPGEPWAPHKPLRVGPFWRKRVTYVAVPYVVWTVIYYAYAVWGAPHAPFSLGAFAWDLLYGGAEYHLYFLLVTVQLYLAFPLISRFVARTAHRAVPVLLSVAAVNLVWLAAVAYVPAPSGWTEWFWLHAYELLPTYSMYILAGCYAAVHFDRLQAAFERRTRQLGGVAAVAAALALGCYAVQVPFTDPRTAAQVIQPAMVFSCIAAVMSVYWVGWRWASGRRRHERTIATLSDASFGVYLAHPLILLVLSDYLGMGNSGQVVAPWAATLIAFVITAGGATLLSLAARRTPLSLALAGRPWRSR